MQLIICYCPMFLLLLFIECLAVNRKYLMLINAVEAVGIYAVPIEASRMAGVLINTDIRRILESRDKSGMIHLRIKIHQGAWKVTVHAYIGHSNPERCLSLACPLTVHFFGVQSCCFANQAF